jgi:hypothetical protein
MNAVPPKISAPALTSRLAVIILAALALAGAAVVFLFNPSTHAFYPVCQFHRLTGLECPGCGATRAVYALLHGNFSVALRDNALFVLALGALAARGVWFGWNNFRGRANGEFFPVKFLWLLLAAALAFTVLRNLPGFAILNPG